MCLVFLNSFACGVMLSANSFSHYVICLLDMTLLVYARIFILFYNYILCVDYFMSVIKLIDFCCIAILTWRLETKFIWFIITCTTDSFILNNSVPYCISTFSKVYIYLCFFLHSFGVISFKYFWKWSLE